MISPENKERKGGILPLLFKFIITIALLIYLIFYVKFNSIIRTFLEADALILSLGVLLLPVNLFVLYERWNLLVKSLIGNPGRPRVISSLFHGFAGGLLTPLRAGEYFIRKIPLTDSKLKDVLIATFLDKMFLLPPLLLVGGIFLILFLFKKNFISTTYLTTLLILFPLLFSLLIFLSFLTIKKLRGPFFNKFNRSRLIKKLEYIFTKIELLTGKQVIELTLLSFLLYLIYSAQFALFIKAVSIDLNFFDCLIISNSVLLLKNFIPPITLGELGVRDAFTIFFVKQFGLAPSAGFDAALIIFVVNLLIPSLIGYFFILKEKK